jgi:hypothetical protein
MKTNETRPPFKLPAGPAERFVLVWAPPLHAATCAAFEARPRRGTLTAEQRQRLRERAIKRRKAVKP